MPGRYSKYIKLIHIIGDVLAILISVGLSFVLARHEADSKTYLIAVGIALASWFICTNFLGTYNIIRVIRRIKAAFNTLKTAVLYIILLEAILNIVDFEQLSRQVLLYHYAILVPLVVTWRIAVTTAFRIYRMKGYNLRNVVILGQNDMARDLAAFFNNHPEYGYRYLGYFQEEEQHDAKYLGAMDDLYGFVLRNQVDEIYCCPQELDNEDIPGLLRFADNHLLRVKFLPDLYAYNRSNVKIDFYDVFPVLIVRSLPLDDALNRFIKRSFDVVFSLAVILFVLTWLIPILAILIKLDSKGPIIFKQLRTGLNNKIFECYKLRTMYVNGESNVKLVSKGDTRITRLGAFLRQSSLDELPQFVNVLFGQMSIVGPRPHMLKADEEYATVAEKYKVRHLVKPGITGLSQVRGYRGDTSYSYQVRGRVRLDIFYLENWSFTLDLKIIYYTVYNFIKGDKHAF